MHLTTKALVLREVNYKEADKILTAWREYSDESADILAYTDGTPHTNYADYSWALAPGFAA